MNGNRINTAKRFNLDHVCNESCPCKKGHSCIIKNYSNDSITLFATKDHDNLYELKYNICRCELILVITNSCNQYITENVIISNRNRENSCIPINSHSQCDSCINQLKCQKGNTGEKGQKGDAEITNGEKGSRGLKGEPGEKGRRGLKGEPGESKKGVKGNMGESGETGETGETGSKGEQGVKGDKGFKGEKGQQGCGFRFLGIYDPCRIYHHNDIVRVDANHECEGRTYIYTSSIPSNPLPYNANIDNAVGWNLMLKDGSCKKCIMFENTLRENSKLCHQDLCNKNIIESYNQDSFDWPESRTSIPTGLSEFSGNPNMNFNAFNDESGKKLKKLLELSNVEFDDNPKNDYYYACKQSDVKYSLTIFKKKWSVPIIFEKILETGSSYDNKKGQIIFNKPGMYKITIHVNFVGTNMFKTSAYLLKPMDNPSADIYQKDRKLPSSKMSLACISPLIKNHLQYCFVVKVKDALSTLVIMSEHQNVKTKSHNDEKEIIIFGKEKTWILIEKMD